jgi:hypothetical protein
MDNQINLDGIPRISPESLVDGKVFALTRRFCHNCGRYRFIEQSPTADCIMISIRVRSEIVAAAPQGPQIVQLTSCRAERIVLGQKIWRSFETFKVEGDQAREAARCRVDVRLKQVAPLSWLRWTAPDGCKGQFRNQQNFEIWWETNVVDEERTERQGLQRLVVFFDWENSTHKRCS